MTVLCDAVPSFCPGCGKRPNELLNPDEFFAGVSSECGACGNVIWQYVEDEYLVTLASQHGDLEEKYYL